MSDSGKMHATQILHLPLFLNVWHTCSRSRSAGSPLNNRSEDGFACGCSGGDPDASFRWIRRNGLETWADRPWTNSTASCDGMYDLSPANCDCGTGKGEPKCPAKPKCPDACPAAQRKPAVTVEGYHQLTDGKGPIENTTVSSQAICRCL